MSCREKWTNDSSRNDCLVKAGGRMIYITPKAVKNYCEGYEPLNGFDEVC